MGAAGLGADWATAELVPGPQGKHPFDRGGGGDGGRGVRQQLRDAGGGRNAGRLCAPGRRLFSFCFGFCFVLLGALQPKFLSTGSSVRTNPSRAPDGSEGRRGPFRLAGGSFTPKAAQAFLQVLGQRDESASRFPGWRTRRADGPTGPELLLGATLVRRPRRSCVRPLRTRAMVSIAPKAGPGEGRPGLGPRRPPFGPPGPSSRRSSAPRKRTRPWMGGTLGRNRSLPDPAWCPRVALESCSGRPRTIDGRCLVEAGRTAPVEGRLV